MAYSDSTDHAEDLFQKTWIRAFEKRGSFRGDGSFEAWLRRLANNVCINDLRARKVRQEVLDGFEGERLGEELVWRPSDPQEEAERMEAHGALIRAIGDLPRREREAICLRILDGKTSQEVAEIMKIKKATIRSNIRHGINRLREIFEGF
jgi:RNA polymerase sigma-70 factor (ECF subfamily)